MFLVFIFIYLSYINLINCIINKYGDKIIISLISVLNNIKNTIITIDSIIKQKINKDLYKISLILSKQEYHNIFVLPDEIQLYEKQKHTEIEFVKEYLININRISITQNKYKNNSILIINNACTLPEGWLEIF